VDFFETFIYYHFKKRPMDQPLTPEEQYIKDTFETPVEKLPELLIELENQLVPDSNGSLTSILHEGLQHFECDETQPLRYDDLQIRYKKLKHNLLVLQHRFAQEGLLTSNEESGKVSDDTKYNLAFARLLEIIHSWEIAIRHLWNAKRAADPHYDTTQNLDVGMHRYRPVFWNDLNPFNKALLYLLGGLIERRWRRDGDNCMQRIYTPEGYDTHAWEVVMSIKDYVHSMCQRHVSLEQWQNITTPYNNIRNAIEYLRDTPDLHFSTLEKDRTYMSFSDGIYCTKVFDPETETYGDRFYWHKQEKDREDNEYITMDLPTNLTTCKYFDLPLDITTLDGYDDWYDIPTPHFQSILDYQHFDEEVCRWMYILLGRLLHDVNSLDSWQVMPFLYGKGGTGKSLILTHVCKKFYDAIDVGVIANNMEKQFGLAAIRDKLLFIAPEVKANLKLDQCDFQTIISGEDMSIPEKFKIAKAVIWTTPGAMGGNQIPHYQDNQGSISRRLIVFDFGRIVREKNTQLGRLVETELPYLIAKMNRAYLNAVNKFAHKDVWSENILPVYFRKTQRGMAEKTNPMVHFLNNCPRLRYGKDFYVSKTNVQRLFAQHLAENSLPKTQWHDDYFRQNLEDRDVTIAVNQRREDPNDPTKRKRTATWFDGMRIVEDHQIDQEEGTPVKGLNKLKITDSSSGSSDSSESSDSE
jgi:hypothetical protein